MDALRRMAHWGRGLLLAALAPALAAQLPPEPAPAPAVALAHRMEHLKAALSSGDETALERDAQEVEALRRTYGTLDMTPLVEGLLVWAREEGRHGRAELGLRAVKLAERWDAGSPQVLSTRITLMRATGPNGYLWSLPDLLKLNSQRLNHPTQHWLWMVQHLAWLRMMATLMLWGWALTMVLRYRRVLRNLWEEPLLKRGISPQMVSVLGALMLAAPVMAGLDPSVSAMLCLLLLAPFLLSDEVKISVLVMALQIVHPALASLEPMASMEPSPSIVALQMRPQPSPTSRALLERLPSGDRDFLRGWEFLTRQDWTSAQAVFTSLQGRHPDQAEVLNNLGVAEYYLGQRAEASKHFDAAFRLNGKAAEILVNQSVLAFERLDTLTGASKQDEARASSPETFERLMMVNRVRKEPRVFALPLPESSARSAALSAVLGSGPVGSGEGLKLPFLLFGVALPALFSFLFVRRLKHSIGMAHPTQCVRCGEPFHTTDSPDPNVCPKCHHLFVLRDGLHQESRKKKLDEVAEFQTGQRRIHRTLRIVLPGCDVSFMGDAREGFMELGAVCLAVGLAVATGRTVRYPGEILPDPSSTWMPLGLVLLVVLYLRSWLKLIPRRT